MSNGDIPDFAAVAATIIAHTGSIKNRAAYAEGCLFAAYAAGRKSAPTCFTCRGSGRITILPPTGALYDERCPECQDANRATP